MAFPSVTLADWRALVEKELAGKSFEKTLMHEAVAGVPLSPLYTEGPAPDPAARAARTEPWKICMRHGEGATAEELKGDIDGGADALWLPISAFEQAPANKLLVLECSDVPKSAPPRTVLAVDPLAWRATGQRPFDTLPSDLEALAKLAASRKPLPCVAASTLPYHDAGADAAEELGIALATGVAYLEALLGAGLNIDEAAGAIVFRVAVGRDTFVEMAKLRALRECWAKVLGASGSKGTPARIHAVSSAPALAVRDPWVNMLRVTTQVFAAVTGGADYVTPNAFDEAFGAPSAQGRRVARNTGLVLREESALGRVSDPAGGSYYFESLTDALARKGWSRFQEISKSGGIAKVLADGSLAKRLEESWHARLGNIAKRKYSVLGVSDFANLGEQLPRSAPAAEVKTNGHHALLAHRDSAPFEELRSRADAMVPPPEAMLVTLGSFAESRGRAGFAATFFASGGIRTRETTKDEKSTIACLCGTDEKYAEEAVARAKALKASGVTSVLLAGRPGALEAPLREAGVDGFLYVGCDAIAVLSDVLSKLAKESS